MRDSDRCHPREDEEPQTSAGMRDGGNNKCPTPVLPCKYGPPALGLRSPSAVNSTKGTSSDRCGRTHGALDISTHFVEHLGASRLLCLAA